MRLEGGGRGVNRPTLRGKLVGKIVFQDSG